MSTMTGVVERKNERKGATNVCIDGVWYGLGFNKVPEFSEGDTIQFVVVQNGKYLNAEEGSVEVVAQGEAPQPKSTSSNRQGNSSAREDYWERKELRDLETQNEIRWQASRNAAIEFASSAVAHGAFKLGATSAKAYDQYRQLVSDLTEEFYNETLQVNE